MRLLKHTLLLFAAFFTASVSFAQMIADPTSWKYEVKKKSANEYQLIFHLDIKKDWHIWSQHPGGDGFQIATLFQFDKNPNVTLKGKTTEKGNATSTLMDGIDGKVTYLSGKVDFIQAVTVKGSTKITGTHTYQSCNDKMCLPPKDIPFVFEIK